LLLILRVLTSKVVINESIRGFDMQELLVKSLFEAGSLKAAIVSDAAFQEGYILIFVNKNGERYVIEKQRGGERIFKTFRALFLRRMGSVLEVSRFGWREPRD
jgi:hypothetical protein